IAGTNRWINFGFFSFQPSEYAKIILILCTAAVFTIYDKVVDERPYLVINRTLTKVNQEGIAKRFSVFSGRVLENYPMIGKYILSIVVVAPIVLLTFIQPALGSSIIIAMIWGIMLIVTYPQQDKLFGFLIVAGIFFAALTRIAHIQLIDDSYFSVSFGTNTINYITLAIMFIGIIVTYFVARLRIITIIIALILSVTMLSGFILAWNKVLPDYQKTRITTFIGGPEANPLTAGYQVRQSRIAIGSGRLLGRGFLQGTQSGNNVLTQAHTDFVFAAISEQFGFIGGSMVMFLYIILIMRVLQVGLNTKSTYGSVVTSGVAALLLLHIFINIGMNLGKLPVTGIPLPLISYGGSSVFVILISLGIVQAIGGSQKPVDIGDNLMLTSRSLSNT
ncbi:FtsW/RodA/SpoVE family cell cycle protein, partial [Candidatus Dojkabacteria bacterium]|nr:FtsW/RodA/SpoVE family cell cycle protein [Candidatus Dojkabacteria bacterium]